MFSIDHIAFSVKDIEKSISFYKILGFTKTKEWNSDDLALQMVILRNQDNIFIELVYQKESIVMPEYAKDYKENLKHIGIKHLALRVKSATDALDFLINKGINNHSSIQMGKLGRRYFFINDPDDNILEFMEEI
jgi:catechol 2,3-dioxygenase-like lactoylglutathione lyase family enzyme